VERCDRGKTKCADEVEDVRAVDPAPDPVLVLDRNDVDTAIE
jgi:hypothetical protein